MNPPIETANKKPLRGKEGKGREMGGLYWGIGAFKARMTYV
ncbi:MAG: hypothetical protein Q8P05_02865 [Candidatus Diapherotrites archaeon]|nr:hypothetical protein [Candidatus Diapherotrites archaeon]